MCSVDFWHQQDYNSLFKGSIGHVTSQCKRPITRISPLKKSGIYRGLRLRPEDKRERTAGAEPYCNSVGVRACVDARDFITFVSQLFCFSLLCFLFSFN